MQSASRRSPALRRDTTFPSARPPPHDHHHRLRHSGRRTHLEALLRDGAQVPTWPGLPVVRGDILRIIGMNRAWMKNYGIASRTRCGNASASTSRRRCRSTTRSPRQTSSSLARRHDRRFSTFVTAIPASSSPAFAPITPRNTRRRTLYLRLHRHRVEGHRRGIRSAATGGGKGGER